MKQKPTLVLTCALAGLFLAGCAQQQRRAYEPGPAMTTTPPQESAPTPAPTPPPGYGPSYSRFQENGANWVRGSMAFPTGIRESSGLLIEKTVPAEVLVGQKFDYVYKVSNLTDYPLHMVTLVDRVTPNFTTAEASPKPEMSDGLATWKIGTLGPKESKTIHVKGSSAEEGSVTTCGWATYSPLLCEDVRVVKAAIALTKTAPAEVLICDPIPMTLVVKNTGSSALSAVKVTDTLPEGLASDGKTSLTFDAGDLAPGQSKEFKFNATAARTGKFMNTAKVTSAQGISADASAATTVHQPVLAITCKAPEEQFIGRTYEVCYTVVNTGDAPSAGSTLQVEVPSGAAFKSATAGGRMSDGRVVWDLGTLPPNSPKDVCVTFSSDAAGTFQFRGTTKGACAKEVATACQTRVVGVSGLLLEKADNPDPVPVGGTTTYTVRVTNQGTADDTNVKMVVEFPAEISPVSASNGGVVEGKRVTFPPYPRLTPKANFSYTIQARGEKAGDARVTFIRTSDGIPAPTSAEESTRVY